MSNVRTKVVRIGNSRGIRIPKVILEQCHIDDEVELETKGNCLIIKSSHYVREGWEKTFQKMHENHEDVLLIDDGIPTEWDEEEWKW